MRLQRNLSRGPSAAPTATLRDDRWMSKRMEPKKRPFFFFYQNPMFQATWMGRMQICTGGFEDDRSFQTHPDASPADHPWGVVAPALLDGHASEYFRGLTNAI